MAPDLDRSDESYRAPSSIEEFVTSRRGIAVGGHEHVARVVSLFQESTLLGSEVARQSGHREVGLHFPAAFRITGPTGIAVIEDSLNSVIQRHASLHSAFVPRNRYSAQERLVQLRLFARRGLFVPGLYELRTDPSAGIIVEKRVRPVGTFDALQDLISETARAEASEPLDMSASPPMRATLTQLDDETHILVVVLSHLLVDGWSLGVFRRELMAAYESRIARVKCPLEQMPIQFPDFARWQHLQWTSGGFASEEAYWRNMWHNAKDALIALRDLPFRSVTSGKSASVRSERISLGPEIWDNVKCLIRHLRVTPYVLFRAVFTVVLYHYTQKPKLAFWVNFANRQHIALENMIGPCAHRHILVTDVGEAHTVSELCRHITQQLGTAQAHQSLPPVALWLTMNGDIPITDTSITFDCASIRSPETSDQDITPILLNDRLPWADFGVRISEHNRGIQIVVSYNMCRYSQDGVRRVLGSMSRILLELVADGGLTIGACRSLVS
jgi:hypothetical protein